MSGRSCLYYPFHLCSRETLEQLLSRYDFVHFRDYMALQLTPMSGSTAFPDRMGDTHADLYEQGRIVQGHNISGPLSPETDRRIDRDLKDRAWREIFHWALRDDLRFQQGFIAQGQDRRVLQLVRGEHLIEWPTTLADVRQMSCLRLTPERATLFEYGLMMVMTSASLWYTIQLCQRHTLEASTDSVSHDLLLRRLLARDRIEIPLFLLRRQ
jgi:hypothetical protein